MMNDRELFGLTLTQRDIFLDQIRHPLSPLYNVGGYIRLGVVDPDRLERAHERLIATHDAFGIRITVEQGQPMQWISAQRNPSLPRIDFSDAEDAPRRAQEWLASLFQTPLATENAELFRAFLVKISPSENWYVGMAHHLSMDGWGFANWAHMLGVYYDKPESGHAQACSWRSASDSDAEYLTSSRLERDRAYWRATLSSVPERLLAANVRPDSSERSQRSARVLTRRQFDHVSAMAGQLGVGPQQIWSALLALYVYGVYDRVHFMIGSPMHNRTTHAQKQMLGVFASMSPMVVTLDPDQTVAELVQALVQQQKQILRHQRYPLGFLVSDLGLQGSAGPLFDVALNYLKLDSRLDLGDGAAQLEYVSHQHEATPMLLTIWEYGTEQPPQLQIDYNLAYFDAVEIERVQDRFTHLLDQLPTLADRTLDDVDVLPPVERATLLAESGPDIAQTWGEMCVHELFEAKVRSSPDAIAVRSGGIVLTYRELDERANRLAHVLRSRGVGPEALVGLCVDRGPDMLIGTLGILKAGGAYVPLDPTYPDARLRYILQNSSVAIVLIQSALADCAWLDGVTTIFVDDDQLGTGLPCAAPDRAGLAPSKLAYVMYTSGSTGQPKGVAITHANIVALVEWALGVYSAEQLRSVLVSTSLNFDLSVFELFVPLSAGHTCVLVRDALALLEEKVDVSLINTVPSAIKVLLEQGAIPACVEVINLCGEPLTRSLLNGLLAERPDRPVVNLYGPTEDTVYSTFVAFRAPVDGVPGIGVPIKGTQAYVLSARGRLLPAGSVGQLYLGGRGVSRGYLGRPDLTAERFIPDPFHPAPGRCMYRTGDLVRRLDDGSLAFIGRMDNQVKIRGHRIELGEIETQLGRLAMVREAIVVAGGEYDQRILVAYLVVDVNTRTALGDDGVVAEVRGQLRSLLAEYMLPAHYVLVDAMPLTANGKVDRRALPPFTIRTSDYIAPSTRTECAMASVWQTVLKIEPISVNANFFEIGGDSLRLVQVIHLARADYGIRLTLRDVLEAPTVEALARVIDASQTTQTDGPIAGSGGHSQPLSPAQHRIWIHEQLHGTGQNNITGAVDLDQPYPPEELKAAFKQLAEVHDVLRTRVVDAGGEIIQIVGSDIEPDFVFQDLRDSATPEVDMARLLAEHAGSAFNLAQGPLFAAMLLHLPANRTVLQLKLHHVVADGWSVIVLFDDLMAILNQAAPTLPPASRPMSYRDYAVWQAAYLQSEKGLAQRAFWRDYLRDANPSLVLPFQGLRAGQGEQGEPLVRRTLPTPLRTQLQTLARRNHGSVFHVLHAALALLLSRLCDVSDLTIGIPVSGRHVPGTERMLGMFVNNLPLRSRVDPATTFASFLRQQIGNVQTVLSHPDLPFETIVELAGLERRADTPPLFQVFFNMLSLPESQSGRQLFQEAFARAETVRHKFNLSLYVIDGTDGIQLYTSFDPAVLSRESVDIVMDQYLVLLEQIARNEHRECGKYWLRPRSATEPVLQWTSIPAAGLPDPGASVAEPWCGSVQALFERQALAAPERIALAYDGATMSYGTLHAWSRHYAARLRAAGIGPGDVVAILTERCDALVVAVLAVMQAGAAFMMLSQKVPASRLCAQVAAVPPRCLLRFGTGSALASEFAGALASIDCPQWVVDVGGVPPATAYAPAVHSEMDDLAYIAFTSGTEGKPKAIRGRHGALTAYQPWTTQHFDLDADDRFGMLSGLVHDPLQRDMFTPLCMGAMLCIPREEELEVAHVEAWLREQRPTVLNLTPSMAQLLVQASRGPLLSLRRVFLAGERVTATVVRRLGEWAPHASLIGLYGATETVRALAWHPLQSESAGPEADVLPVGRGVSQVQMLVLNTQMTPCGVGEPGQIAVRSPYLALGYHDDPDLTAQRFVTNPVTGRADDIIYLTGDKGRYRSDGVLECLGRLDRQLKVRGFRVEPAEIEVCISSHPDVRQAAVIGILDSAGGTSIAAYLVPWPDRPLPTHGELASQLASRLPSYMMPTYWVEVAAFPMNENGKLDSKKLPLPVRESRPILLEPPATQLEETLLRLWQNIFDRKDIGIDQDFFTLGGHSLLAAQLLVQIENEHGVKLGYRDFFAGSSIRAVAAQIETAPARIAVPSAGPALKRKRRLIL
jgi:amino acid adenylation domain-containing protein